MPAVQFSYPTQARLGAREAGGESQEAHSFFKCQQVHHSNAYLPSGNQTWMLKFAVFEKEQS